MNSVPKKLGPTAPSGHHGVAARYFEPRPRRSSAMYRQSSLSSKDRQVNKLARFRILDVEWPSVALYVHQTWIWRFRYGSRVGVQAGSGRCPTDSGRIVAEQSSALFGNPGSDDPVHHPNSLGSGISLPSPHRLVRDARKWKPVGSVLVAANSPGIGMPGRPPRTPGSCNRLSASGRARRNEEVGIVRRVRHRGGRQPSKCRWTASSFESHGRIHERLRNRSQNLGCEGM